MKLLDFVNSCFRYFHFFCVMVGTYVVIKLFLDNKFPDGLVGFIAILGIWHATITWFFEIHLNTNNRQYWRGKRDGFQECVEITNAVFKEIEAELRKRYPEKFKDQSSNETTKTDKIN